MAESMPFLKKAKEVTVVVITDKKTEEDALASAIAVEHLKRHDINAVLRHVTPRNSKIGDVSLAEAHRRKSRPDRDGRIRPCAFTRMAAGRRDREAYT
jgi:hypothetical protein